MLIRSPRHTVADLELWAELEEADRAHGEYLLRSGKVERSIEEIRRFAALGPCYAGVSGGKDSSVLVHLVRQISLPIPLVHIRAIPHANPDTPAILSAFGGVSIADADYRNISHLASKLTQEKQGDAVFFGVCDQLTRRYGRRILGVRGEESRVRKMRMIRWGCSTEKSCAPIGWWTTADVFAYAAVMQIPLHPAYGMLGGGRYERDRLRVDELGGECGRGGFRDAWEREYYGPELRRLEAGKIP